MGKIKFKKLGTGIVKFLHWWPVIIVLSVELIIILVLLGLGFPHG